MKVLKNKVTPLSKPMFLPSPQNSFIFFWVSYHFVFTTIPYPLFQLNSLPHFLQICFFSILVLYFTFPGQENRNVLAILPQHTSCCYNIFLCTLAFPWGPISHLSRKQRMWVCSMYVGESFLLFPWGFCLFFFLFLWRIFIYLHFLLFLFKIYLPFHVLFSISLFLSHLFPPHRFIYFTDY